MRGATISLREDTGIRLVHFSQDEVIADVPYTVERRHDTNEELLIESAECPGEQKGKPTTTKRRGAACLINQHATRSPTARRMVTIVSQSFRAHHSVSKKQTPRTMLAILLATMLKPQKVSRAPIRLDPRYPAGNVIAWIPPDMCVT